MARCSWQLGEFTCSLPRWHMGLHVDRGQRFDDYRLRDDAPLCPDCVESPCACPEPGPLANAQGLLDEQAAGRRSQAAELEAIVERQTEALAAITAWVTTHGHIENHGHRDSGSTCHECQVLNEAIRAAVAGNDALKGRP
jgi:hypothetical protein